ALAQIAGAFAGAAMVPALVQDGSFTFALVPAGSATLFQVLLAELLFSFLLALVYLHALLGSANQLYSFYGLAIGLTYGVAWLAIREISGSVLNPALGLGVDTLAGAYEAMWPYLLAPLVGAALAAFAFRFTSPNDKPIPLKSYFPKKAENQTPQVSEAGEPVQEPESPLEVKPE
ncbi:MAG: aquaporin, partial [Bacteroidota bacterium]